jgi:integrase
MSADSFDPTKKSRHHPYAAIIDEAIGSAATKEVPVARKRFARGSVYLNSTKTAYRGTFPIYYLDESGNERRRRPDIFLGLVKDITKREACRRLQLHVDAANAARSKPLDESKDTTLDEFLPLWERSTLCMKELSTQATARFHTRVLRRFFGSTNPRKIGPGVQLMVAALKAEGYSSKTARNIWSTLISVLKRARDLGYIEDDKMPRKPDFGKLHKPDPRYFNLAEVAEIITASKGRDRKIFFLMAETGLRSGEVAGLRLSDVTPTSAFVRQSIWCGRTKAPKNDESRRELAISAQLAAMLSEEVESQKAKGHTFLFSTAAGTPLDMNLLRRRKFQPHLASRGIEKAGFHAFRHFNASLMGALGVPLKTVQRRLGHASSGCLTIDVYTHPTWKQNVEAAQRLGDVIEKAVNSVCLSAIKEKRLPAGGPKALDA